VLGRVLKRLAEQEAGQQRLEALVLAQADELERLRETLNVQLVCSARLEGRLAEAQEAIELLHAALLSPFAEESHPPRWRRWLGLT
jgi:hypothetical protein